MRYVLVVILLLVPTMAFATITNEPFGTTNTAAATAVNQINITTPGLGCDPNSFQILLVMDSASNGTAPAVSSVTDVGGNTWTRASGPCLGGNSGKNFEIWYTNGSNACTTISAHFSDVVTGYTELHTAEFYNVLRLDKISSCSIGSGTTPPLPTISLTTPGELVIGGVSMGDIWGLPSIDWTPPTGYTRWSSDSRAIELSAYQIVTGTGNIGGNFNITNQPNAPQTFSAQQVAFLPITPTPTPSPTPGPTSTPTATPAATDTPQPTATPNFTCYPAGLTPPDTCADPTRPCTLPVAVTTTVTKLLPVNNRRVEFFIKNVGSETLYVMFGTPTTGPQDTTYGIPVNPLGQQGDYLDMQIQPDPAASPTKHTIWSSIYLATANNSTCAVYGEANH